MRIGRLLWEGLTGGPSPTRSDFNQGEREYFAAAALNAIILAPGERGTVGSDCKLAVEYADALMAALEPKP